MKGMLVGRKRVAVQSDQRRALSWNTQAGLVVVAAALTCSACAPNPAASRTPSSQRGEPSSTLSPSAAAGSGPLLTGTVTISGTYEVTGIYSTRPQLAIGSALTTLDANETCADYADGFAQHPTSFAIPLVQTAGERTVYLQAMVADGYHGPGTYTNLSTPTLTGTVQIGVGSLDQGGFVDVFDSGTQSRSTLTVRPDGSGTLGFSGWSAGDNSVNGTLTWMCRS